MTDEELAQLFEYENNLEILAKNSSRDTFDNRDHKHASIVLGKILKYSTSEFILFDDDLKGDIVNNDQVVSFKSSLIDFIARGGKIRMVISHELKEDDEELKYFLINLSELYSSQFQIKLASIEFKKAMKAEFGEKINFAVGDSKMYRLEKYGHLSSETRTREAQGSFNDQGISSSLTQVFNAKYEGCHNYPSSNTLSGIKSF